MNNNFIFELLIDPITGEPLIFDNTTNTLKSSSSGKIYQLIESVPCILVGENQFAESEIHRENGSYFNYHNHYQKDADLFDYSEENIPEITKNELIRLHESIVKEISNDLSVVLDVGCGNGWASKKLIPLGKKVISMDISSTNSINAIRKEPSDNHAGLIADVYNIPIKDNSIDCIIASEILEHLPDPKLFIVSMMKLLKQNGKLIITTPYNEKIEYYLCIHCNKPTPKFAHLHSFNNENIIHLIPKIGVSWKSKRFLNHYLIRIRSHVFLKYFSFNFWNLIDTICNRVFFKPTRLQIIITKSL